MINKLKTSYHTNIILFIFRSHQSKWL